MSANMASSDGIQESNSSTAITSDGDASSTPNASTTKLTPVRRKFGSIATLLNDPLGRQYFETFVHGRYDQDSFKFLVRIDNLKKKYKKIIKLDANLTLEFNPVEELFPLESSDLPLIEELFAVFNQSLAEDAPKLENFHSDLQALFTNYKKHVLIPLVESTEPLKLKKDWCNIYNQRIEVYYVAFFKPALTTCTSLVPIQSQNLKLSPFGLANHFVLKESFNQHAVDFQSSSLHADLIGKTANIPDDKIGCDPFAELWPLIIDLRIKWYRYLESVDSYCITKKNSKIRISPAYLKVISYYKSLSNCEDNFTDTQLDKYAFSQIAIYLNSLQALLTHDTEAPFKEVMESLTNLQQMHAKLKSDSSTPDAMVQLESIVRRASSTLAPPTTSESSSPSGSSDSLSPRSLQNSANNSPALTPLASPTSSTSALPPIGPPNNVSINLRTRLKQAITSLQPKKSKSPPKVRPSPLQISSATGQAALVNLDPIASHPESNSARWKQRSYSLPPPPSPKDAGKQMQGLLGSTKGEDLAESKKSSFFSSFTKKG